MSARTVARFALLTALAMVLSWVEFLLPLPTAIPGVKLGLTNLVVLFALYRLGTRSAWCLSLLRVLLVSFTFGNAFSLWYSLAGAVLSLLVMMGLKKTGKFSVTGVSVGGAVCHNLGQILVAMAVLQSTAVAFYYPALLLSGTIAGICIGLAGGVLVRRIPL